MNKIKSLFKRQPKVDLRDWLTPDQREEYNGLVLGAVLMGGANEPTQERIDELEWLAKARQSVSVPRLSR